MKKRKHIMVAVCDFCPQAVTHVSRDGKTKTCTEHHEHIDSNNYQDRTSGVTLHPLWHPPCLAHLEPEPCPTCAAYIAAGL